MSELPVPVAQPPEIPSAQTRICQNCATALSGEYCTACGQRHEPHVHSVMHFAHEAFESVTHADSRLWRSLWFLLSRPGFLTKEFFAGRRASFLPPFRLYLVVSVLFFVVGTPHDARFSPDTPKAGASTTAVQKSEDGARDRAEAEAALNLAINAKANASNAAEREAAREALDKAKELLADAQDFDSGDADEDKGIKVRMSGIDYFCREFVNLPDSANSARNHLRDNCRRLQADDGRALGTAVLHNVPRAMFLFLPLLALIMWLIYWRPQRYYVEHLLLLIHNHAFVFIAGSIIALFDLIPGVDDSWLSGWFTFVVLLYVAWYLFRSMRVYYGQGRALTLVKYVFLTITYCVLSLVMLLLTLIFSALTL